MKKVPYSYLPSQFQDIDDLIDDIRAFVPTGDFTLGKPVEEFEEKFARLIGTKHAIGVGSGTDAIKISLKAAGVNYGDEVITTANTFIATVGAINETGATTVFVDCDDSFCMNVDQLESTITDKTKAIVPVHLTGYMANMPKIMEIANKYNLIVIEDACQAILAEYDGVKAGKYGLSAAFSMHPLKNLNVWGDAGVIVTDDDEFAQKLKLFRNHGLETRDTISLLGYNSRLDSIQAIIGNNLVSQAVENSEQRIENAQYVDDGLKDIAGIRLPERADHIRIVYHLYMFFAENRDELYDFCQEHGIECKVHYPIPLYQQEGLKHLGYKKGDFPVTDRHCNEIISFPVDQYRTKEELDYIIEIIRKFYNR